MKTLMSLRSAARQAHSDPIMRHRWFEAVIKLRESQRGWLLDKPVKRVKPQYPELQIVVPEVKRWVGK